jgi:hypothetical protein
MSLGTLPSPFDNNRGWYPITTTGMIPLPVTTILEEDKAHSTIMMEVIRGDKQFAKTIFNTV